MARLAIVGGGFMGGALAEGLIDSGWNPRDLIVAEIREARREFLEHHLKVPTTSDGLAAVRVASSVLFAVKPQDIPRVLDTVAPAAIGEGATAIARGRFATDDHLATALNILSTVGRVVVVEEAQMDAVTAVSGSGPAYVFYLAEALISAAEKEGLTREQACVLVYQTFVGASELLSHDPAGPAELRARVTSPGGTTEAAMDFLEQHDWMRLFEQAVHHARQRSEELGR